MVEATAQRQAEKATNTATVADAAAGEEAVKQACPIRKTKLGQGPGIGNII